MKFFTVKEANEILPSIIPKLEAIRRQYAQIAALRESAKAAAVSSEFGGGMIGGSNYVKTLYDIGKITTELNDLGIQLKDYTHGLIDFPSLKDGRIILLCWQIGDGEQIEWWHEADAGFAGRQRL